MASMVAWRSSGCTSATSGLPCNSVAEYPSTCPQLGREYKLKVLVRPSFNPNFRIVDAGVADAQGVPLVRLSAIIPRY